MNHYPLVFLIPLSSLSCININLFNKTSVILYKLKFRTKEGGKSLLYSLKAIMVQRDRERERVVEIEQPVAP